MEAVAALYCCFLGYFSGGAPSSFFALLRRLCVYLFYEYSTDFPYNFFEYLRERFHLTARPPGHGHTGGAYPITSYLVPDVDLLPGSNY